MLHKFWRLYVYSTGSTYFDVTEVSFLDATGTDVSVGGVASANSEYDGNYSAGKAFDKSFTTDYCNASGRFPAILQYAHPSPVDVASVRFRWAGDAGWLPRSAESMVLASSSDGVTWLDFYDLVLTSGGFASNTVAVASVAHKGAVQSVSAGETLPVFMAPSSGALASVLMGSASAVRDVEHGGPGAIYGTTKTKGTPNTSTKARVVLLHQRSKLPVREAWSEPSTGYFEFRGIDTAQKFIVLAEDADGNFRPVAANRLTPEVLP